MTAWLKNIVNSLSQIVGAFILMSGGATLFDPNRKTTSSTVREFSLMSLRSSDLGVCSSSIFRGRSNSMGMSLVLALKRLLQSGS
jgi:hypothetical protein